MLTEYQACEGAHDLRKTHLFAGRYENIYATERHMPSLRTLLAKAREQASGLLDEPGGDLGIGHWVNAMYPGHVTLPHTHDDDDESLSAVYYVRVPPDSGDLLLRSGSDSLRITPEEGMLVMFPPDMEHEVSEHRGQGIRLSIAMNFGLRRPEDRDESRE